MEITRNCGVIRGRSPSTTVELPPKSDDHIYSGANFLVCLLTESCVVIYFISALFTRLFSAGVMSPTASFFSSPYFFAPQRYDGKRFHSLHRARHGGLSGSAGGWQKVAGKYHQKVDILLQLFHHDICSGESLTYVPFRAAMMLSAGEKILNNKSVVVSNV